jgi:outer membrane biosynthesis protein TonB
MEKISLPVRIFAILIVLAGLAGMLAMRTMGPSVDESAPIPQPVRQAQPSAPAKAAPKPAKTAASTPTAKTAKPAPAKPKPAAAKPKPVLNPVVPPTGFPVAVDRALREHAVVVVSLVQPGARVDELAAAEAQAGAKLSGAGFIALNVLNERVARALLTKLDTARDSSLLVLKRSGEVALELDGFVDRETVAQAAANASP